MKKILVSVIVPVYNVSTYLEKCLDSIINQTYKNLEIILIDDGSTDDSGKICDKYAKRDKRIKVIHKKNEGPSCARNIGIEISKGDFFTFIDSDDYLDLKMIERLLNDCLSNDCEISIINKIMVYKDKEIYENYIEKNAILNVHDALKHVFLKHDTSICNKLFKASLFKKSQFPKNKIWEDLAIISNIFVNANKIYLDANYGYYYYQHDNSITNSPFSIKKMDYAYNTKKVYDFVLKKYPDLKDVMDAFYIMCLTITLSYVYTEREKYKKEYIYILEELKKYKKIYKKNKNLKKSTKIKVFLDLNHMIGLSNMLRKIKNGNRVDEINE